MENINALLVLLAAMAGALALAVWYSPKLAEWLGWELYGHALATRAAKEAYWKVRHDMRIVQTSAQQMIREKEAAI